MDRFLQQLLNRFLGRLMNTAISKGVDYAARRGKAPGEMTAADHQQTKAARDMARKAQKAQRAARRLF